VRRRRVLAGAGAAVLAAPAVGRAQQDRRIGILTLTPGEAKGSMAQLLARLDQLGYREGRNLVVDYGAAEGDAERLAPLAAELAARKPDVIVTGFGTLAAKAAKAAKAATTDVPVVFTVVGDPVGAGLVATLAKPGGNLTGLTDQSADAWAKRLGMLHETTRKPGYAVLVNPATPFAIVSLRVIREAAEMRNLRLEVLEARAAPDILPNLARIDADSGGLLVVGDPLTTSQQGPIAAQAIRQRLATCFQARENAEAGGLIAYGADLNQLVVRAADYVDRIFKGTWPADLPVEQPTRFELVVNLRTAKLLGLAMPPSILAAADEAIE
jgi:putative tryptophan/tyrosine transport system substrate-binding protein